MQHSPIAIVGMDCLLPGADSAEAWIARALRGQAALTEVPEGRWPLDPAAAKARGGGADGTTTTVGCFVQDSGSMHDWVRRVTERAFEGVTADRERTSLLLANLSLPSTEAVRASALAYADWLQAAGVDTAWLNGGDPKDRYQSGGPALDAANALGLGGTAIGLDAACASGLYAVRLAMDRLALGLDDCVLAAGVQKADSAFLHLGFTQLQALSASGVPRPFDARADGLVIGEGAACVVLKRLDDALADGDTVHAVLDGGGLGNDGRSGNMLSPDAGGQLRTLQAAWQDGDLDALGYVECHATGTSLGDGVELRALRSLLGEREVVLGSAKALVGHTITVAGLAGLIRAVGAVRDAVLPAQPGVQPRAEADGFRVLDEATPWASEDRVAAVSAFGFGGTNAHVRVRNRAEATPYGGAGLVTLAVTAARAHLGAADGEVVSRGLSSLAGAFVKSVQVDPGRFRMPPRELQDLLPQQLLALDLADRVVADDGSIDPSRTGAVLGMGVDGHVADHVLRWAAGEHGSAIAKPLTPSRVQGLLPNFVANRLAAQLGLEGPSWTVSAEALSGLVAIEQAAVLLATGSVDAVVAGAVDLPGHPGFGAVSASERGDLAEGGALFVLRRLPDVDPSEVIATLELCEPGEETVPNRGHAEAAQGALALFDALGTGGVVTLTERGRRVAIRVDAGAASPKTDAPEPARSLPMVRVPHGGPALPWPQWSGSWGGETVPTPLPRRGPPVEPLRFSGAVWDETAVALPWDILPEPAVEPSAPIERPVAAVLPSAPVSPSIAVARPAPSPRPGPLTASADTLREAAHLAQLAQSLQRATAAATAAHSEWLTAHTAAAQRVAQATLALTGEGLASAPAVYTPPPMSFRESLPAADPAPFVAPLPPPSEPATPELFDLQALRAFAEGSLSSCLGPDYADLDAYEPRVRLPMDPLLLVSRVVEMDAERGELGPARLVTEYDLPHGAIWDDRGKPPVCVMIESGQADLFLVSVLGVDAHCKGERIYRLLDCDLTFHGERPQVGETLRHDIRIKSFAKLGGKILFYFEYDCTSRTDGRPVLTMRNGVAGFFTPAELAVPQGVDPTPQDLRANPVTPRISGAPSSLDEAKLTALREGRYSAAFGPSFAGCDGAALRPSGGQWGLFHRVPRLELTGGPHGLGQVRAEQDLRDDDWFNPCHFKGDPCMPGTLMFDGCVQALQLWLLASGFAADYPDAHFEPMDGETARLRCRGQVVPGQKLLVYDARIQAAGLTPTPWVKAEVILHVDGTPVVRAENVTLCLSPSMAGTARPEIPTATVPSPAPVAESPAATLPDETALLEYSVGLPSVAFGEPFRRFDGDEERCARMPGPPVALIHEVLELRAEQGVFKVGDGVKMRTRVPVDAPYLTAQPGCGLPVVALMEIALQPCGWLTGWGGAVLGKGDLYFRNLGGDVQIASEAWDDVEALVVDVNLTGLSESGGMIITSFDMDVRADDGRSLFRGDTQFGYFTAAALSAQKGLRLDSATSERLAMATASARIEPIVPTRVREDWRQIDRITAADAEGGEHGLGFYAAEIDVDPEAWFFVAHFHQDPVMPGSLGVEGLAQLAAHALGGDSFVFLDDGSLKWIYRGQVTRERKKVLLQLEVTERSEDRLVCTGWLSADGLPIYSVEGLSVRRASKPVAALPAPVRDTPVAALLDSFEVQGDEGTGTLRLDPAQHPWLADHCPTLVTPAVPMAFAIEIAAEAALQLRPGMRVIGAPKVQAERWIAPEEPADLLIAAVAQGDLVMVSLALHHHNERFPALSGPKVHMSVVVELADAYPEAPAVPAELDAQPVALPIEDYYAGGYTFHGPSLQGMIDLGRRSERGSQSTFRPGVDADLLADGSPGFVLDPMLLDVATHPMMSAAPEIWGAEGPGTLAYPIGAEDVRFYGPRPEGEVRCDLRLIEAGRTLVFDVTLSSATGVWTTFRWVEAVVDGGLLGLDPATIRTFCMDKEPAEVRIGRPEGESWRVGPEDLVEPLEGMLVGLLGRPEEISTYRAAADRLVWLAEWLAVKESVRERIRTELGRDVHPSTLRVLKLTQGWVVVEATALTSQEHLDVLGPTRILWLCTLEEGVATASAKVR